MHAWGSAAMDRPAERLSLHPNSADRQPRTSLATQTTTDFSTLSEQFPRLALLEQERQPRAWLEAVIRPACSSQGLFSLVLARKPAASKPLASQPRPAATSLALSQRPAGLAAMG